MSSITLYVWTREFIIIIIITHISIAPWGPKIQRRLQQRRRTKSVWTGGFSSGAWMRERSRTVECQQVKSSRRMGLRQYQHRALRLHVYWLWRFLEVAIDSSCRNVACRVHAACCKWSRCVCLNVAKNGFNHFTNLAGETDLPTVGLVYVVIKTRSFCAVQMS